MLQLTFSGVLTILPQFWIGPFPSNKLNFEEPVAGPLKFKVQGDLGERAISELDFELFIDTHAIFSAGCRWSAFALTLGFLCVIQDNWHFPQSTLQHSDLELNLPESEMNSEIHSTRIPAK